MARPFALLTATFALALQACAQPVADSPAWLREKIAKFESLPPASPPRAILRTSFRGRTAYYVTATCCDIPSELYDESGRLLCYPGGGFAGGDGRCPGLSLPPDAPVVWHDGRTRKP